MRPLLLPLLAACSPTQVATPGGGSVTDTDTTIDTATPADTSAPDDTADSGVIAQPDTGIESIPGSEPLDDGNSDVLFTDDEIPIFEITVSQEGIDALLESPYEYVEASLTYNNVTYGPIALRTKGENSWRPFNQKSSLKLDFNRYEGGPDRFLGLKGLTFNAMNEDYSMMHERVAYRMYRAAGVAAVRANHAVIYVNGELYGLFTVMDTVDDLFLARWFEDTSGSLYEQHDGDYTDDYVQNNDYFQLEEGEGDRSALQAIADALEGSGAEAIEAAGEHLSWDSFHRYWAVGGVVQNFDAYPFRFAGDDCHVYHDPTTDRIHYIPHGADETFYYTYNIESSAAGHLSAKCLEVDSCRAAWVTHVEAALDVLEKEDLAGYADTVREQIAEWAAADPNRNYTMEYVDYYQQAMIDNINGRRDNISADLGLDE
jgi:spore coat protein CotH